MIDLKGKAVLVLGLGRFNGGVGVTKFLVAKGAQVRVSDQLDSSALASSISELKGLPIDFRLGGHDESHLTDIDLVVVNPAIPPTHPFLNKIIDLKIPLT